MTPVEPLVPNKVKPDDIANKKQKPTEIKPVEEVKPNNKKDENKINQPVVTTHEQPV